MNPSQLPNIAGNLTAIQKNMTEIIAAIQSSSPVDPEAQARMQHLLSAATISLAEMRTLILLATGSEMPVPAALLPLRKAIDGAIEDATQTVLAGFSAPSPAHALAVIQDAEISINQAKIAALHLIAHLGAAMQRVQKTKKPRLEVVGAASTSS